MTFIALLAAGIFGGAVAQTPEPQSIGTDNLPIHGEFLAFFQSMQEPFLILGYPITGELVDSATNKVVQYFQSGRLEQDANAQAGQRISISHLGSMIYTPGAPTVENANSGPTCRTFPAYGKNVCFAFLQFFDDHNGARYLGNPISNVESLDGRMVQYFENGRLEWRPEKPVGQRVGVSPLGKYYHDKILGESSAMALTPGLGILGNPTELISRAFVASSLLPANSQQKLFVIVQNQRDLTPVTQANVSVIVTLPNGRPEYYRAPATDANGISIFAFPVESADVKQIVNVDVVITTANGTEQRTKTWFRIWW